MENMSVVFYTCPVGLESLTGAHIKLSKDRPDAKKPSDPEDMDRTELYGGTQSLSINNF